MSRLVSLSLYLSIYLLLLLGLMMDIDFNEYKFRCELRGHDDDVRSLSLSPTNPLPPLLYVSRLRDRFVSEISKLRISTIQLRDSTSFFRHQVFNLNVDFCIQFHVPI